MASVTVNLRIVDATTEDKTLYEGTVSDVTVGDVRAQNEDHGVFHLCNGMNNNENPFPGPTCTNALYKATHDWDGTYYPNMEDYFITKILNVEARPNTYWSLWLNFKPVKVGGCQAQVKNHDSILWALIPSDFNGRVPRAIPLKLNGPRTAKRTSGTIEITVIVTNGSDGSDVGFAEVRAVNGPHNVSAVANKFGNAELRLTTAGTYRVRAMKGTNIPSNELLVVVT